MLEIYDIVRDIWYSQGNYARKYHQQNYFLFHFTIVSTNLIQIGALVTEIQNFGKDLRLILY